MIVIWLDCFSASYLDKKAIAGRATTFHRCDYGHVPCSCQRCDRCGYLVNLCDCTGDEGA